MTQRNIRNHEKIFTSMLEEKRGYFSVFIIVAQSRASTYFVIQLLDGHWRKVRAS